MGATAFSVRTTSVRAECFPSFIQPARTRVAAEYAKVDYLEVEQEQK